MSGLIDRQAAIDVLYNVDEYNCLSVKAIQELPSAQPIIRCKDCKHFGGGTYCHEKDGIWNENDFCSYAERKEQDDG